MSDITLVVERSRKIESLLKVYYHAQGKGLHQLISSCEDRLPNDVIKKLRFIATMKNKVVHEKDYQLEDKQRFKQTSKLVIEILTPRSSRFIWMLVGGILVISTLFSMMVYLIYWDTIKGVLF